MVDAYGGLLVGFSLLLTGSRQKLDMFGAYREKELLGKVDILLNCANRLWLDQRRTLMSMSLTIRTLSDREFNDISAQPLLLDILLYGAVDADLLEEEDDGVQEAITAWTPDDAAREAYFLEGAFSSLHYLLTGKMDQSETVYPLNFLMHHRHPVGEVGWGPASLYSAAEVQAISTALNSLDPADLRINYDADTYNALGIYPRGYTWKPEDEHSLLDRFDEMKAFINRAAAEEKGICLTIM